MTDIFKEAKEKVMPSWAKFVEDGDSVQGTYVGKIEGQIDGYGNEQVIYQLLQNDNESIVNVGFGLNKKFIIQDMNTVKFGQIVGFKYKGKISIKDKFGKAVQVKDFGLHQDPKIVNAAWLKENKDSMPEVIRLSAKDQENRNNLSEDDGDNVIDQDEPPFMEGEGLLTDEDKLMVIEKLAKDKLGATNLNDAKTKIMENFEIAFIPINYDQIIGKLKA